MADDESTTVLLSGVSYTFFAAWGEGMWGLSNRVLKPLILTVNYL
jgi:hypothetical protein